MSGLERRKVVDEILRERGDLLVVTGLGSPTYDAAACGDVPNNFPLWGGMGGAVMVGLGLALAQPERRILVLTGDGEMLMGLGSLATVAAQQPRNLRIVVLDNEQFGETGQQRTHTAMGTDLALAAKGCGIANSRTIREMAEIDVLRREIHSAGEPVFAVIKVLPQTLPRVLPPRDGAFLVQRMRAALLGTEDAADG